jgi:hypothetical protein
LKGVSRVTGFVEQRDTGEAADAKQYRAPLEVIH